MAKKVNLNIEIVAYSNLEELSNEDQKLLSLAEKATFSSYAPYSNFNVGAALILENGEIISGNNQENAAYPSGMCAERTAMYFAGASHPNQTIKTIAIAARKSDDETFIPISPCGACRQAMLEYEAKQETPIRVIMKGIDDIYELASVSDLLPFKFTQKDLFE
ncbi:cytidine deaminase [Flammeovirga kamogawensis]|uniref:Cytidine deaminase n=1 Tax=Flammeovirga kamogawensis TaxID=373891 RepID=A0ABX8GRA1_9BACT|nr:cytidine deaminase [Flammeovirga kamogawensis]MBB6462662.1 cytidine deaminase [Flammeovirga kamogawensis]QWG06100.1 cytidine deaminase [Flammeovirga kamogawensis]TRX67932.1 cytidine deaminase [Flammeovirga kamogawensis]